MTLESLLANLNEQGWILGSLCQLALRDWYACLIDMDGYVHTATAPYPCEAISAARGNPPKGRLWSPNQAEPMEEDFFELIGFLEKPTFPQRRKL